MPAQFGLITISLLVRWLTLSPDALEELDRSALAFVANIYFSEASELVPLLHFWSRSLEEQFYLIYPLLLGTLGLGLFRWQAGLLAFVLRRIATV